MCRDGTFDLLENPYPVAVFCSSGKDLQGTSCPVAWSTTCRKAPGQGYVPTREKGRGASLRREDGKGLRAHYIWFTRAWPGLSQTTFRPCWATPPTRSSTRWGRGLFRGASARRIILTLRRETEHQLRFHNGDTGLSSWPVSCKVLPQCRCASLMRKLCCC
jgi:hypothetical protein